MELRTVKFVGDRDLTVADIMELGTGHYRLELSPIAIQRIKLAHGTLMKMVTSGRLIYGVNTGFGQFSKCIIDGKLLSELQVNLVRQSAAGVGPSLSEEGVRRMLALRINTICQGKSGCRLETVEAMLDAFNNDRLPLVPVQGTVGASGDLAPLSHLTLGVFGEGELIKGDKSQITARLTDLGPKEGLAMVNGTQFITSLAVEAVTRAQAVLDQGLIVAAMSIEALKGITSAFHPELHAARRHRGQRVIATRIRQLLPNDQNKSALYDTHNGKHHVQDAYSIRCLPQILGIVYDVVQFVCGIINAEINAVTDNPLIFLPYGGEVVSGGNFHGQYPAKAMDILAMTIHDVANVSERRTERLVNPKLSQGLPACLTPHPGLKSGYMIAQYSAAALVSENKVLCHPSSVDSIPTSANQEDHVSMGGWSARKCLQVLENVERVIAIELVCATQALDLRKLEDTTKDLTTTPVLQAVHDFVRKHVPYLEEDRELRTDIETATKLIRNREISKTAAAIEGFYWSCSSTETDTQ